MYVREQNIRLKDGAMLVAEYPPPRNKNIYAKYLSGFVWCYLMFKFKIKLFYLFGTYISSDLYFILFSICTIDLQLHVTSSNTSN